MCRDISNVCRIPLLGVTDLDLLRRHPKLGASWEGFAIEEIIRSHGASYAEAYFWNRHAKAEIDLLLIKNGRRFGFEVKYTDTPKVTASMRLAQKDLALDELVIVYPGDKSLRIAECIKAMGLLI